MKYLVSRLCFLLFITILFINSSPIFCQPVSLKVSGDAQQGYHVDIYNNNKLIVTGSEEFSLDLYNLDQSTEANIDHWTGEKLDRR